MSIQKPKRLSKQDRRSQLLEVAKVILENDGAEALTLALLAERAGVSKPIAYDHFATRSGLLVALLKDIGRYYETDALAKIAAGPQSVGSVAAIVAKAYVLCSLDAGPAATVLSAAIEADAEVREVGRAFQAEHAALFERAFSCVLKSGDPRLPAIFSGLVAAANAICVERMTGTITTKLATETLQHMLASSLVPFAKTSPQ